MERLDALLQPKGSIRRCIRRCQAPTGDVQWGLGRRGDQVEVQMAPDIEFSLPSPLSPSLP